MISPQLGALVPAGVDENVMTLWRIGVSLLLACLGFIIAPAGPLQDGIWLLVSFGSVAAVVVGIRAHRPESPRPWRTLAAALSLLAVGGALGVPAVAAAFGAWSALLGPLESVLYLTGYLGMGLASLRFARSVVPEGDSEALLDGCIVMVSLVTVLWGALFAAGSGGGSATALVRATLVVLVVTPSWSAAMAVRVLFVTGARIASVWLLSVAVAAGFAANTAYGILLRDGVTGMPRWVVGCWLLAYAAAGAAALHPSMQALARPAQRAEDTLPIARVAVLGAALFGPPLGLLLVDGGRHSATIVGSLLLSALVCWRFAGLIRRHLEDRAALTVRSDRQAVLAAIAERGLRNPSFEEFVAEVEAAITGHIPGLTGTYLDAKLAGRSARSGFQLTPVVGRTTRHGFLLAEGNREAQGEEADFLLTLAALLAGFLDRHEADEDMRRRALHDHLTGLPNRTLLLDRLDRAVGQHRRHGTALAVLFIDLDGFKQVNDTLGHAAGDALLRGVAARLAGAVRATDTVARFSGDEFVILVQGATQDGVRVLAGQILGVVTEPMVIGDRDVVVGASIGLVCADEDMSDPAELLLHADWAMYRAKAGGRGRVEEFDVAARADYRRRLQLELDLPLAVDDGQLRLCYRPVRSLGPDPSGDALVGVEAIVRWEHPELGSITAAEVLDLAEATGLAHVVLDWTLYEAGRALARWRGALPLTAPFTVRVGLSAGQLGHPLLHDRLRHCLAMTGALAAHLLLAVADEVLVSHDQDELVTTLDRLRALGLCIGLDDRGTGSASLTRLRTVPIDVWLMDRRTVRSLASGRTDHAIVVALADVVHRAGVVTLARGIEDAMGAELVRSLGCGMVEGAHVGGDLLPEEVDVALALAHPAERSVELQR